MPRSEILARYRRLRQISKRQHEAVLDIIAPSVLLDWARRLDLTEGKAIVLENDNEMTLPEDLAIYLPRPGRSHPLDRYARVARVAPGSDVDKLMLQLDSLVATGVNGIVVPRGDANAFGEALAALAADRALCDRYGRASLERVRHFTIDSMVEQTLALYTEAMAWRGLPAAPAPTDAANVVEAPEELALATSAGAEVESL